MSTKNTNYVYIGSCNCLHTRFRQHNSGYGAHQTASATLRPWALLGFVSGFQGQDAIRIQFENRWINEKNNLMRSQARNHATVEDILNLVHPLKEHCNSREDINVNLVFFDSGTLRVLESNDEWCHQSKSFNLIIRDAFTRCTCLHLQSNLSCSSFSF